MAQAVRNQLPNLKPLPVTPPSFHYRPGHGGDRQGRVAAWPRHDTARSHSGPDPPRTLGAMAPQNPFVPAPPSFYSNPGSQPAVLSPKQKAAAWDEICRRTEQGLTISRTSIAEISTALAAADGAEPTKVAASASPEDVQQRRDWLTDTFGLPRMATP